MQGAILINDQSVPQSPILGLTSEYIERNGAYLLDCGDAMILFVNRAISISFCMEILDVPNFQSIPEEMVRSILFYWFDSTVECPFCL